MQDLPRMGKQFANILKNKALTVKHSVSNILSNDLVFFYINWMLLNLGKDSFWNPVNKKAFRFQDIDNDILHEHIILLIILFIFFPQA